MSGISLSSSIRSEVVQPISPQHPDSPTYRPISAPDL
jgi:hypothetical protein